MARPIAVSKTQTWTYVLEDNRKDPENEQVVWHLRSMSRRQKEKQQNMLSTDQDGNTKIMLGSRSWYAVEIGLADVDNLTDENGDRVKPEFTDKKKTALTDDFLSKLPSDVVNELALEIQTGVEMSVEEEKKPEPPLT